MVEHLAESKIKTMAILYIGSYGFLSGLSSPLEDKRSSTDEHNRNRLL